LRNEKNPHTKKVCALLFLFAGSCTDEICICSPPFFFRGGCRITHSTICFPQTPPRRPCISASQFHTPVVLKLTLVGKLPFLKFLLCWSPSNQDSVLPCTRIPIEEVGTMEWSELRVPAFYLGIYSIEISFLFRSTRPPPCGPRSKLARVIGPAEVERPTHIGAFFFLAFSTQCI